MDNQFFDQAQAAIMKSLKAVQPELMSLYGRIEFDTKHDKTVVTHLDKSIEADLRKVLKELDSGIGIEGEEFGIEGNRDTYWLVDPIDGTEQFIRGIPSCKNLLTLVDKGQPVWALMYMFAKDELWLARKGQGVTCNGQSIRMHYRSLNRAWIELSVNLSNPENVAKMLEIRPHIAGFTIRSDTSYLVAGKVDGALALESGGGPWDYAPRALLYEEAGGRIANIDSETYDFNDKSFLMAHERNFNKLNGLLQF